MCNVCIMRRSSINVLFVSVLVTIVMIFAPTKHSHAQLYTDSITFKIDSVSIEGNELVYSIMFWRPIENWRGSAGGQQDTVLAHLDLYFWMKDMVFNKEVNPMIVRHHPNLNAPNSLLDISCRYHAGRFQIALRTRSSVNAAMLLVPVKYNQPVELCRIRMPLNYADRNPEFIWDEKATGGKSYSDEPLLKELQGNIFYNPTPSLVLTDYFKTGFFCQGDVVKLWASGYSTGSQQKMTWLMSKNADMSDAVLFDNSLLGSLVGEGLVQVAGLVDTDRGDLYYQISASNQANDIRVDTLMIFNAPGWLDSMYFQCILSDASTGVMPRKSNEGDIQVYLRDSIFGYFATTSVAHMGDASTSQVGASDRTDTIFKCPTSAPYVSFYFFGPKAGRESYTIGSYLSVSYEGLDALINPIPSGTVELSSWSEVPGKTAPNGRKLYRGTLKLPAELTDYKVWVTGISTQKGCNNGAPFTPYDTVYITDMTGDNALIQAVLSDTTLSGGESMNLNTDYAYTNYYLKTPNNGNLVLNSTPKKYMAPASVCDNAPSCKADTLVYQYQITMDNGDACTMEVSQIINLADYYYLKLKVLLEGPYVSSNGLMNSLQGIMQLQSPYNANVFVSTWPAVTATSPDKAIADWIEVSLRTGGDLDHKVDSVSAFLLADGSVCDKEGKFFLKFKQLRATSGQDRNYYITVEHRNHLMIRSELEYQLTTSETSAPLLDLTNVVNVYQGNVKLVDATLGLYGMYAGAIASKQIINIADLNEVELSNGSSGYVTTDVDFNWVVNYNDYDVVDKNNGVSISLY